MPPPVASQPLAGAAPSHFVEWSASHSFGGTSVGEDKETMYRMVGWSQQKLPLDKPRYLMGVGAVNDLLEAVSMMRCGKNAEEISEAVVEKAAESVVDVRKQLLDLFSEEENQ